MLRSTREELRRALSSPPIGIVIPTHNRSRVLLECLDHLSHQTFTDFEIIIVDDGSSDDTADQIAAYQSRSPMRILYLRQQNSGPARARNTGVAALRAPVCLFLGDDIFACPTLVEHHLELHRDQPDIRVAGLGLTEWATSGQQVTPFMKWLDGAGLQFAYPQLLNGAKPEWCHFYTSNLSVKAELLQRFPFNEQFPYAAMEDSELAYRIQKEIGLDLRFLPAALAHHLHPTSFRQACRRMLRVGYSSGLFQDLWPEQRRTSIQGMRQRLAAFAGRNQRLLYPLVDLAEWINRLACPNPFMALVLQCHLEAGFESWRRSELIRD
jgi:glycosyltransferase involved in cell wall biosynthesis